MLDNLVDYRVCWGDKFLNIGTKNYNALLRTAEMHFFGLEGAKIHPTG